MKPQSLPTLIGALLLVGAFLAQPVHAHCDSLDGPVVNAARAALAQGDVDLVLIWVTPEHEPDVRNAFERTIRVRALGDEAAELADLWFFETLVRLHRAGEGAPYTGLKPAGWKPPAIVVAADSALVSGEINALAEMVSNHMAREIREMYDRVKALENFPTSDLAAGRRFIAAYVEYVHLLEGVHHLLHGGGHDAAHADH